MSGLSEDQIYEIQEVFSLFETRGNGKVEVSVVATMKVKSVGAPRHGLLGCPRLYLFRRLILHIKFAKDKNPRHSQSVVVVNIHC